MATLIEVFHFIAEVFEIPAIILGLVALIGLLLQHKGASDVIKGTFKTVLGLLILGAGAGVIVGALSPFASMFEHAFNLQGVVPFDEALVGGIIAVLPDVAIATSMIMVFGFVVNLILARFTPFKYIFLTGHMIWIMAACLAWALYDFGLGLPMIILIGSVIQGMVAVILPAIAQPIMRKLTGGDKIAYSHLSTLGVCGSAYIGKIFGDKEKDAEDIKMPKGLDFFRDIAVSVSLVMFIIYLVVALVAGNEYVSAELSGGQNFLIFSFIQAFTFAAGVLILLQGVRMFIGEIIPAFRGVAARLIPGAVPALDCPVTFQYGPTSLMLGFVLCVVGMLCGIGICIGLGIVIPLPSIIGGFFTGGTSGIFGNTLGGRRGACIAGFMYGLVLTVPMALFYPLFNTYGVTGLALSCSDAVAVLAIMKLAFVTSPIVVGLLAVAAFVAACVIVSKKQKAQAAVVAETKE